MELYNTNEEFGCRILLILVVTRKKMQAEIISVYDYFSIHIEDIYSDMSCLHPSNPNHSSELIVKRILVREALSFLVYKGLIKIELSEKGIYYFSDDFSEKIVELFKCNYTDKYIKNIKYVDDFFKGKKELEISKFAQNNIVNWKSIFEEGREE